MQQNWTGPPLDPISELFLSLTVGKLVGWDYNKTDFFFDNNPGAFLYDII
jgi:hypothetical protein